MVERYRKKVKAIDSVLDKAGKAFNRVMERSNEVEGLAKLNAQNAAAMYEVNEDLR